MQGARPAALNEIRQSLEAPPRSRSPRRWPAATAVVAVAVLAGVLVWSRSTTGVRPTVRLAIDEPAGVGRGDRRPSPPTTSTVDADNPTPSCPSTSEPSADVDSDGCPDALSYADGILTAGRLRFALGAPGDELLVGDWDGSRRRTVALFRPSTGAVFWFAGWASSGVDVTVTPAAVVAGATSARVTDVDGDGRDEIVVTRRAGAAAVVRLSGGAAPPRSPTSARSE